MTLFWRGQGWPLWYYLGQPSQSLHFEQSRAHAYPVLAIGTCQVCQTEWCDNSGWQEPVLLRAEPAANLTCICIDAFHMCALPSLHCRRRLSRCIAESSQAWQDLLPLSGRLCVALPHTAWPAIWPGCHICWPACPMLGLLSTWHWVHDSLGVTHFST